MALNPECTKRNVPHARASLLRRCAFDLIGFPFRFLEKYDTFLRAFGSCGHDRFGPSKGFNEYTLYRPFEARCYSFHLVIQRRLQSISA